MKTVLFVIHRFHYSGAAKALQLIANGLQRTGEYDVTISTYSNTKPCYFIEPGVHVITGKERSRGRIKKYIEPVISIRKIIRECCPDIVVSFLNNASFYSLIASFGLSLKIVVCERSDPYNEKSGLLPFMRKFFRFADGAVFQTEGARQYYSSLINKSVVIPNIVDCQYENIIIDSFEKRKNRIDVFSRLEIKQKRLDILVRSFSFIHEQFPNIILNLYGDGPDEDALKELKSNLGLDGYVFFKGSTYNVFEILKDSKITILTSDYEGIPNSVIDAMAIGIPVVATDTSPGGVRELIKNGENGIIVPCGDAKAIADAVIELLNMPKKAETISRNATLVREKYSDKIIIPQWDAYFCKIMKDDKKQ